MIESLLVDLAHVDPLHSRSAVVDRFRQLYGDVRLARSMPAHLDAPSERHLLIVDHTLPDPTQDSGSDKIVRIARMAAAMGYSTVLTSLAHRDRADVADTGVDDITRPTPGERWNDVTFWDLVGRSGVIWLERPVVAGRMIPVLRRARAARRIIVSGGDLHHVRLRRQAELSGRSSDLRLARRYGRLERSLLATADVNVAITPDEESAMRELAPTARIEVMPNVHEDRKEPIPPRQGRQGLVFIGNYRHRPNVDAVRHLVERLMPMLWRTHPETELIVVGNRLPPDVVAGADPRIVVRGWVEDLRPDVDSAVAMVAPLRFGAGMKGKIGLAMANGLPVVTNEVGAEGMSLVDRTTALIAEDDEGFARRCSDVLSDEALWQRLSDNARRQAHDSWSAEALMPALRTILEG